MKTNVGSFDGWFRILTFLAAISYTILVGGNSWVWIIPTSILFATAVLAWCPLYEMLGVNTNKDKGASH